MLAKGFKLVLVAASLFFAGLACSFSFSSAKVENLRLAKDDLGETPTTTFGQGDTFYLLGELSNAPDDTKLKASWIAVEAQDVSAGTMLDEAELVTGSGTFNFYLENNAPLWPSGRYKVDFYLNDELEQSLEFQVEQTAPLEISNLHLAADGSGEPSTDTFNPADTWHLAGDLANAPGGTAIKTVWSATGVSGDLVAGVISEQEDQVENGPFVISFKNERTEWPSGSYSVDVYLNGSLSQTLQFSVSGGANATADQVRMATDENGTNVTTVFSPSDIFYLVAEISNAPSGSTPVRVVWTAVNVEGAEPNHEIKTYEGTTGDGSFWSSLTSDSGTWPAGDYRAELYLNDQLAGMQDFEVVADGSAQPTTGIALQTVYLAKDSEGNRDTNVFAPTDTFYLIGDLVNAPQGGKLEANWIAENVDGLASNEQISEPEVFEFSEGSFSISLANDKGPWAKGQYKVEVLLNGAVVETREFSVSDIKVIDPYMATDDTGAKRTTIYGSGQAFYLHFTLGNAPAGTKITPRWYRIVEGEDNDEKLNEEDYTFNTGEYYVRLTSNSGPWTPGDYVVDIYLNDYFYSSVFFTVQ